MLTNEVNDCVREWNHGYFRNSDLCDDFQIHSACRNTAVLYCGIFSIPTTIYLWFWRVKRKQWNWWMLQELDFQIAAETVLGKSYQVLGHHLRICWPFDPQYYSILTYIWGCWHSLIYTTGLLTTVGFTRTYLLDGSLLNWKIIDSRVSTRTSPLFLSVRTRKPSRVIQNSYL